MATGAWLLIAFLATRMPSPDQLRDVDNYVQLGWWILFIAWCASAPRNSEAYRDLSPARSGTAVVAVCGITAAMFLDRKSVVSGKRVSVRVDLGGRRINQKKK